MPQTNCFHVTNSCSKWGQKLYHLAKSSNARILGKWWWTALYHLPFSLYVVGLLHVTQQPKNCLENTMEVSETSNTSTARQHSFLNTYTEQKDDVWILHRYSFQVLLFFSRKVITRRVYVIYTLRAYPWPILQVHEAKSVCQSYATPWDWRFHYVQSASLFYCWVFFCNTPTWKFSKRNHSYYIYSLCFWDKDFSPEGCEIFMKVGHICRYTHTWPTGWCQHFNTVRWTHVSDYICRAFFEKVTVTEPSPVAERSKERVCGSSLAGIAGSNPAGGMDVCVVCVVQ